MGIFDFLKGRGRAAAEEAEGEAVEFKDYRIHAKPRRQGSTWLLAGITRKTFPDGVKEHHFIRADTFTNADDAKAFAIEKAKRIIDERGERMFEEG
jgi:hypothetical protein